MNKKILCLLMAALTVISACLIFTGCNKVRVEIDLEAVAAANKTDALLARYDSFMIRAEDGDRTIGYYVDDEIVFEWSGAYKTSTTSYKEYYEIIADGYYCGMNDKDFYSIVHGGGELDTEWTNDLMLNPELFTRETLISSSESDGIVTFKTRLTDETMIELGYWNETAYKGCYYETVYTMEKDSLVITSIKETFFNKPAKKTSTIEYVLTANVDRPEKAVTVYDHVNSPAETCTATIVFDPGTENEKRESFTVPKGDVVYFYWEGDYDKVYKNAELTQLLSSSHVNLVADEDVTIYLTKSAK
ncbi:MAG: hypothetical protein IJD59_02980 [Clostridia bacterium]|nr:hypothetical protein [Clostridia bacterium]